MTNEVAPPITLGGLEDWTPHEGSERTTTQLSMQGYILQEVKAWEIVKTKKGKWAFKLTVAVNDPDPRLSDDQGKVNPVWLVYTGERKDGKNPAIQVVETLHSAGVMSTEQIQQMAKSGQPINPQEIGPLLQGKTVPTLVKGEYAAPNGDFKGGWQSRVNIASIPAYEKAKAIGSHLSQNPQGFGATAPGGTTVSATSSIPGAMPSAGGNDGNSLNAIASFMKS